MERIRQYDSSDTGHSDNVNIAAEHQEPAEVLSQLNNTSLQLSSLWGVQVLLAWRPLVYFWWPLVSYVTVLYFHWKSP